MLASEIREILAEEEEVQRRKEALESLVDMRAKLLRESLEARMRRARTRENGAIFHKKNVLGFIRGKSAIYSRSSIDFDTNELKRTEDWLT